MDIGRGKGRVFVQWLVVVLVAACGSAPASPSAPPSSRPSAAAVTPSPASAPSDTLTPQTATPTPIATTVEAVTPFHDSDVACTIGAVQAADTNAATLTPVADCAAEPQFARRIQAGGLVTTDPCGQAVLNSRCGTLYVFQDSTMRFSKCDQQTTMSGAGCVADGTIAWANTCPEGVAAVVTPAASIALDGTWISATYLPDRQVALFTVLDGSARATPLDATGNPTGPPVEIPTDSFWFTGTNGRPSIVGGLDGQRSYPIAEISPVIEALQLASVMSAVKARAASDGVRTDLPAPTVINVRAHGGEFNDVAVQEMLLASTDWSLRVKDVFADQEGTIFGLIGFSAPIDLNRPGQAFSDAAGLLKNRGVVGTPVTLLADREAKVLRLAETLLPVLKELGLDPDLTILDPDEAVSAYDKLGADGRQTIWLSMR